MNRFKIEGTVDKKNESEVFSESYDTALLRLHKKYCKMTLAIPLTTSVFIFLFLR